jgi:hypothetical protein
VGLCTLYKKDIRFEKTVLVNTKKNRQQVKLFA